MGGMSTTIPTDTMRTSGAVTVRTFRPQWLTCDRCGHVWKSRAKAGQPRCSRCERTAKGAALEASRAVTHS